MQTVVFETDNAIFYFESSDAICHLKYYSEQKVREAIELSETISSSSSEIINIESDYFGFIVLDLIKAGKGEAYCKTCKETYDSSQLRSVPLGFGKTSFSCHHLLRKRGTEYSIVHHLKMKLPAHRSGLPGKVFSSLLCPSSRL